TAKLGISAIFIALIGVTSFYLTGGASGSIFIISAAMIGGYMAINIGANDVANNIGPAVGSKVLTMGGALLIAAIFEASGALIAGGDVVSTISKGIINPDAIPTAKAFILAMMAALLAAALWINLATWVGAPVSTTHSIVGGVLGAGVATAGLMTVNWPVMGGIAAAWVISPVMGGVFAALFLVIIKFMVLYRRHKVKAAITWVPILVGIMATAFSVYLAIKGFKKIWTPNLIEIIALGIGAFVVAFFATKPLVKRASVKIGNTKKEVNALFKIPMIFAAALLSFAHGANDVANAVGPLAAIVSTVTTEGISATVGIPLWVMLIGGVGLSVGLILYGPKLVKTVGSEITKLNPSRAFSVALSAAITVIIASWLGLPVSSTHTAVGGVFGVGFLREFLGNRRVHMMGSFFHHETGKKTPIMQKINSRIASLEARKLVRRRYLYTICAAWIITVPVSAFLAGLLVFGLTYIAG
ncbi:MAG: inorganic phosphate transporter, partial [Sphingomonadales bacterium]